MSSAGVRLSIDCSMNVAGRKIVVSISMPGQAGAQLVDRVLDARGDLHRVGAAELLDDQHQAGAVVDDAPRPTPAWWSSRTLATSDSRSTLPSRRRPAPWPAARARRSAGRAGRSAAGRPPRRNRRCRPTKLSVYCSTPRVDGVGARLHHPLERDAVLGQLRRVDLHVALLKALTVDVDRRDPGDPQQPLAGSSSRRSPTSRSGSGSSEARPIFMMRLVADSGGIIHGGRPRSAGSA